VNYMKSTMLTAAILFSLAGPAPVLAEAPAQTVKPLAVAVVPVDVESTEQQAGAETLLEAAAPVTELAEQQAVADTLVEAAVTTVAPVEPQVVSVTPVEAVVPAGEMIAEPVAVETPAEEVAAGAVVSTTDTSRQPCPMGGMGMMRKGMGQGGPGPGGRKPGCDRDGRGQQNCQEQVVRRLDMIEARMAKMEAMLESLMQR
jgi:hypothetical protein